MGRFSVDFEVANNNDIEAVHRGLLQPDKVRRMTVRGVVDSGAARFVLPKTVVDQLGLRISRKIKVRYADHRTTTRPYAEGAYVELLGRYGVFNTVVEPKRDSAFIGAIVLEDLDFLVDCTHQRLVPRDPRFVVSEIE
jgi:predicted aspartyl protease